MERGASERRVRRVRDDAQSETRGIERVGARVFGRFDDELRDFEDG